MTIRAKVLLAIMLAVVLSIIGVTVMVSVEMNRAFVNNFKVSSKAQLDRMNAFVGNFFANAISNTEKLAASPIVTENIETISAYLDKKEDYKPIGTELPETERKLYEELSRMVTAFPSYALVYVSNNAGGITQSPDDILSVGFNPAKRPWYLDAVRAGKTIITEAYISDSGGAVCTIATPIRGGSGKGILGVAAIDILLDTLTRETGRVNVGKTGYVIMIDSLGQVISDPKNSGPEKGERERWLGKSISAIPGDAGKALQTLHNLHDGYVEVAFDGKIWLASVQTTQEGWELIMFQEKAEVFADALSVTFSILFVGAIIAVVMLAIAFFVARSIARPVAQLADASQAVSEGDLKAIPQEEALFKGELGTLHKSLKRMVDKLAELIETANKKMTEAEDALALSRRSLDEAEEAKKLAEHARSEGIKQTAQQLGTVIEQLAMAGKRLAKEAQETGNRTQEQRRRVAGTASAIVQMNSAVGEVAQSTSRTARLAEEAREEARKGKALVIDMVKSMGEIEKQSIAMRDSLSGLGAQAHDIGQILGIINDIADQTNLLALNAAIEAARAGEAGRGFAVVADEVRKLAEKTVEATKQVAGAIHTIQDGTSQNMVAIEQAAAFIGQSAQIAHKAGDALTGIEKMVENTAGEVRSIATASEEQSATLEEINRSTEGINSITTEVAESAKQSNAAVQELTQLSDKLGAIVTELKKG